MSALADFLLSCDRTGLDEGIPNGRALEGNIIQGSNAFGNIGYRETFPGPDELRNCVFDLYALDRSPYTKIDLII